MSNPPYNRRQNQKKRPPPPPSRGRRIVSHGNYQSRQQVFGSGKKKLPPPPNRRPNRGQSATFTHQQPRPGEEVRYVKKTVVVKQQPVAIDIVGALGSLFGRKTKVIKKCGKPKNVSVKTTSSTTTRRLPNPPGGNRFGSQPMMTGSRGNSRTQFTQRKYLQPSQPARPGGGNTGGSSSSIDLSTLETKELSTGNGKYVGTVLPKKLGDGRVLLQMHGRGKYTFKNGSSYTGDFREGKKTGKGKFVYSNGNSFEGEFKGDKPNGQGIYLYKNGEKYVGGMKDGKMHGKGRWTYSGGNLKYEGEFFMQKKHGKGVFFFPNGNKYSGHFINNLREGKGRLDFKSGTVYVGIFKNDKQEGMGSIKFKNGQEWIGNFKNNKQDKEFIRVVLEKLNLAKYYNTMQQKGFQLSMMRELDDEEFDILLEICITDERDRNKIKFALKKESEMIMKMLKDIN